MTRGHCDEGMTGRRLARREAAASRDILRIPEPAQKARQGYRERLRERVEQFAHANLPRLVDEGDHEEILTEAIEGALLELLKACQDVVLYSGLPEAQAVAHLIERELGREAQGISPNPVPDVPGYER